MQRSIHTSIVDCQMSTGKEDPALENASPSMVKERASTSHKLEYLCNLFPLSAVDLWVALALYRQTNSAWEHSRAWRTNFTKWTISNGENFPWYTLVRHLRKEKFISESVQIYFKGMSNREYAYSKKKKKKDRLLRDGTEYIPCSLQALHNRLESSGTWFSSSLNQEKIDNALERVEDEIKGRRVKFKWNAL